MPEGSEFSKWGVPQGWRKWLYGGVISILLGFVIFLGNKLDDCWDRNDSMQDKSNLQLEKWADKILESKLKQAESEKIDPKIEEIQGIADSIKTTR